MEYLSLIDILYASVEHMCLLLLLENIKLLLYNTSMAKQHEKNTSSNSIWMTAPLSTGSELFLLTGLEAGHFYANPLYSVSREHHNSYLLLFTVSGCGEVKTGDKTLILERNQAIIIDCHSPHSYHSSNSDWEFLWLHYSGFFATDLFDYLYQGEPQIINITGNDFSLLLKKVINNLESFDNFHRFEISTDIQQMILMLSAHLLNINSGGGTKDPLIEKAIDYMEKNFDQPITIELLSSYLNISQYHFIRVFKKLTGLSPYSYLISYRITRAKKYLVETSRSVEDISQLCGFNDTTNFITKFKSLTGETPLKYRKNFQV